jgi:biotin-(acetyl-CoA carboxylase) ligase
MPYSFYLNQQVKVQSNNSKIRGVIKDLDQSGKMYIIQTEHGANFSASQDKIEPDYSFRN